MYSFVNCDWFKSMFPSSREMPLELVTHIDVLNQTEKQNVLSFSILNLHRVLSFSKLADESFFDDPEQFWVDTIINIENTSYYASMLLPYLRQVIEDNTEIVFTPSILASDYLDSKKDDKLLLQLRKLFNLPQSQILYDAIRLSRKIEKLEKKFSSLVDENEFNLACLIAYRTYAELIRLSTVFMLPNSNSATN